MKPREIETPESFNALLIAPCGINCGRCIAHLRQERRCAGCNSTVGSKANHCATCKIKNCAESENGAQKFCFTCAKFPCARMRQLDKRYRLKYGTSLIENLERIRDLGSRGVCDPRENPGEMLPVRRGDVRPPAGVHLLRAHPRDEPDFLNLIEE